MSPRQLFKILCALAGLFTVNCLLLYVSDSAFMAVFLTILGAFPYIVAALCAVSLPLFTYADNVSKEITEVRNEVNRVAYEQTLDALSNLKKEILHNCGLVIALLLFEYAVNGVSNYWLPRFPADQSSVFSIVTVALRFSIFLIAVLVVVIQLKGGITAVELRDIFAKNRK